MKSHKREATMKEWKSDYDMLATYNAEVSRGIVHNSDYTKKMQQLQEEYYKALTVPKELLERRRWKRR